MKSMTPLQLKGGDKGVPGTLSVPFSEKKLIWVVFSQCQKMQRCGVQTQEAQAFSLERQLRQ